MIKIKDKVIAGNKDILYSEVLIKNKAISVREILRLLANGQTEADILMTVDNLKKEDVIICYEYAFQLIGAIEFEEAIAAIEKVDSARNEILSRLDKLKGSNLLGKYSD